MVTLDFVIVNSHWMENIFDICQIVGIWHKGAMNVDGATNEFENTHGDFKIGDVVGIGLMMIPSGTNSTSSIKCFASCNGKLLANAGTATCPTTDPTGIIGVNVHPGSGNCQAPCSPTSCSGFNWAAVKNAGFQYVLYANTVGQQRGCLEELQNIKNAGLILSAQHEANPSASTGDAQATYFVQNGGAWVNDGLTMPGTLHMQFTTISTRNCLTNFDATECCYGLNPAQIQQWMSAFASTYLALTGRNVILSTDYPFWQMCTGMWSGLAASPLVIANADDPTCGTAQNPTCPMFDLPWSNYTFWLNKRGLVSGIASTDVFQDKYSGTMCQLSNFAKGI